MRGGGGKGVLWWYFLFSMYLRPSLLFMGARPRSRWCPRYRLRLHLASVASRTGLRLTGSRPAWVDFVFGLLCEAQSILVFWDRESPNEFFMWLDEEVLCPDGVVRSLEEVVSEVQLGLLLGPICDSDGNDL